MKAFGLAILIFVVVLVSDKGHCHPLKITEDTEHNLVKRADPSAAPSKGTDNKYKFGMGSGYPYMGYGYPGYGYGYPGYGYDYPGYGYGMPGMGMGYGGAFGGSYGGGFGGGYSGGMLGRR